MMRLAHFPPEPRAVEVGLCFCSPERSGFEARFTAFDVGEPATADFH